MSWLQIHLRLSDDDRALIAAQNDLLARQLVELQEINAKTPKVVPPIRAVAIHIDTTQTQEGTMAKSIKLKLPPATGDVASRKVFGNYTSGGVSESFTEKVLAVDELEVGPYVVPDDATVSLYATQSDAAGNESAPYTILESETVTDNTAPASLSSVELAVDTVADSEVPPAGTPNPPVTPAPPAPATT